MSGNEAYLHTRVPISDSERLRNIERGLDEERRARRRAEKALAEAEDAKAQAEEEDSKAKAKAKAAKAQTPVRPPIRSSVPMSAVIEVTGRSSEEHLDGHDRLPDTPALSQEEIDEQMALLVLRMWESRATEPAPHVRVAARALFAWHNQVIHPMLVTEPLAGQVLHHLTSELLVRLDPDFFLSELGPGRRGYVPNSGQVPDDVEYVLAKRLLAWIHGMHHNT